MAKRKLFVSNTWTPGEEFPPCGICGKEISPSWGDYIFRLMEKGKPVIQVCSSCALELKKQKDVKVTSSSPFKNYIQMKNSMWQKPF